MDLIVDPKLFVTCRLCLEDMGQYQIVPTVQQKIKFCFDIDVEPFDGLPQLLCVKCKEILTNFYTLKKLLCEKQDNLRNKVAKQTVNVAGEINIQLQQQQQQQLQLQPQQLPQQQPQQQQDIVSSSQQIPEIIEEKKISKPKAKRVLNSSESENSCNTINSKKKKKQARKDYQKKPVWDWVGYKRDFVCIICNTEWPNIRSYRIHYRLHANLTTAHSHIFDNNCSVNLDKIDNKPNITGTNSIVVHNSNKIIEHCNNSFYIRYSKLMSSKQNKSDVLEKSHELDKNDEQDKNDELDKNDEIDKNGSSDAACRSSSEKPNISDSSDSEQDILIRPKQRNKRVFSRSSNETVVIESNTVLSDNEDESKGTPQPNCDNVQGDTSVDHCISIVDSSDSDLERQPCESTQRTKQPLEARLGDYKIIQGIISLCASAYHRKYESIERTDKQISTDSQLKHKVLSIGRKIIHRQGFNCTGLLRYLEQRPLIIDWLPKVNSDKIKEPKYIRIVSKMRGADPMDDSYGWARLLITEKIDSTEPNTSMSLLKPSMPEILKFTQSAKDVKLSEKLNHAKAKDSSLDNLSQSPRQPMTDTTLIYICPIQDSKSKLLNASPVANPKQLPRKLLVTDSRISTTVSTSTSPSEPYVSYQSNSATLCMPIITSTTSLAQLPVVEKQQINNTPLPTTTKKDSSAPRIKVKPVTELMSERTLNNMRKEQFATPSVSTSNMLVCPTENMNNVVVSKSMWPPQSVSNLYVSSMVPQMTVANQQIQLVPISCLDVATKSIMFQPITVTAGPMKSACNMDTEFVVMNTVELPNTTTKSPIQYFGNLLKLHNLSLIHSLEVVPAEFLCLIKFRVNFKQESVDEPVEVCLSLYNYRNEFCFNVNDKNKGVVNLNKVSPNWQWEILTILIRGQPESKALLNSQKHSKDTFDRTNRFICLLKSIECRKMS